MPIGTYPPGWTTPTNGIDFVRTAPITAVTVILDSREIGRSKTSDDRFLDHESLETDEEVVYNEGCHGYGRIRRHDDRGDGGRNIDGTNCE